MTRRYLIPTLLAASATAAWAGKPCTSNIPLQWDLRPTYVDGVTANAIQSDGSPYVSGQPGIGESDIRLCDGTGDAVLILFPPTRSDTISFSRMLASTPQTPAWALSGSAINCATKNVCWDLHVLNAWFVPAGSDHSQEYEFTTHLRISGPLNVHVYFVNPGAQAVPPDTTSGINSPYPDSLVRVHHCPAEVTAPSSGPCAGILKESWLVWPDANPTQSGTSQTGLPIVQVASLLADRKGSSESNAGEFTMPFYFVINSLQ